MTPLQIYAVAPMLERRAQMITELEKLKAFMSENRLRINVVALDLLDSDQAGVYMHHWGSCIPRSEKEHDAMLHLVRVFKEQEIAELEAILKAEGVDFDHLDEQSEALNVWDRMRDGHDVAMGAL